MDRSEATCPKGGEAINLLGFRLGQVGTANALGWCAGSVVFGFFVGLDRVVL
jgi:hypothetical protein